jgi:hypothetical protein
MIPQIFAACFIARTRRFPTVQQAGCFAYFAWCFSSTKIWMCQSFDQFILFGMSKKIGVCTPKKRFAAWASLAYQFSFPADTIPITSEPGPPVLICFNCGCIMLYYVVLFIQSGVQHPIVCLDQSNDFHKPAPAPQVESLGQVDLCFAATLMDESKAWILNSSWTPDWSGTRTPSSQCFQYTLRHLGKEWNRMNEGGQFPRFTFVSSSVVYFTWWVSRRSVCPPEEVPSPKRRNDLPVGLEIQVLLDATGVIWGSLSCNIQLLYLLSAWNMGLEAMLRTNDRTTQEWGARTTSVNHYKNAARMAQDWTLRAHRTTHISGG